MAADETNDPVTGLLNRRIFDQMGPELAAAMNWAGQPYSMALINVDDLDRIAKAYGRDTANEALRHVAGIIAANVRETDLVARFSDDDLVLVIPSFDAERAFGLAERIRQSVADAPFTIGALTTALTISVGVYTHAENEESFWAVFKKADSALTNARSQGRNRIAVAPAG